MIKSFYHKILFQFVEGFFEIDLDSTQAHFSFLPFDFKDSFLDKKDIVRTTSTREKATLERRN